MHTLLKNLGVYCSIVLGTLLSHAQGAPYLIPVNNGLHKGSITFSANTTFDSGTITDVFDGDFNTLARTPSVNPLVLTLSFPVAFPVLKTRVMSATDADWSLETASSLSDLDNHTGSYRKLVDTRVISLNTYDEFIPSNPSSMKLVRLTLHRTEGDDYVHLREWELYGPEPIITNATLCPAEYYLTIGLNKKYKLSGTDNYGFESEVTKGITWSSSNENTATVDTTGKVTAVASGTTQIIASYQGAAYKSKLSVGSSFTPLKADKKIIKVALLFEDPYVPGSSTIRWHERFDWNNPAELANQLIQEMNNASDQTVEFTIAKTIYGDIKFTDFDGHATDSSFFYHRYKTKEGFDSLLYWAGQESGMLKYNYNAMLDFYQFCEQREAGTVDEVWVFSHPAGGMYESRLAGENAFWYNSPPITGSTCVKLLPIMGFNNAVSVDYAMHSIGHRAESAMAQAYGGWNPSSNPARSPFDLFTRIDKDFPELSQVGSIHFTPNSPKDYDYSIGTKVTNYASNWSQYPLMGNTSTTVNCEDWACGQQGYMRWWFGHLPRFKGVTDGVLNDWWHYIVHFEEAVSAAQSIDSICGNIIVQDIPTDVQENQLLAQGLVSPNPSQGMIEVRLPNQVGANFVLFDAQGKGPVFQKQISGTSSLRELYTLPKGLYLYQINEAAGQRHSGKLVLE